MSGTRGQGARRRRSAKRRNDPKVQSRAMRKLAHAGVTADDAQVFAETYEAAEFVGAESIVASASGSTSLALGPRDQKWDAAAADKAVRAWAGAEDAPNAKYASAFMVKEGDGTNFTDYKLGFAQPDGDTLKANWGGVTAVAGVLSGARGGANISDADAASARAKVEGYYAKARTAYDDDTIKVPWANTAAATVEALAAAEVGYEDPALLKLAMLAWEQEFAPVVQGKLLWDEETGVVDLMCDIEEALNGPGANRFCVLDVATSMDAAIVCEYAMGDGDVEMPRGMYGMGGCSYWLVPFKVGNDREPVVSPASDWTALESGWVEDTDDYRLRLAEFAMPACENCDHAYTMHLGTDGPCTGDSGDCPCDGYKSGAEEATVIAPQNLYALSNQGWTLNPFTATSPNGNTMTFTMSFAPEATVPLPEEHQPGQTLPERNPSPAPAAAPSNASTEWSAIFAPEGKLTSDGRAFAPGSITWRELPLTLMAMTETSEGGHVGAKIAGQITDIWRDEQAGLIRAKGVWDTGDYGQEIARMVNDETLRGVSVDLAIQRYDVGPRSDWFDDDGNWAPKDEASRDERSIIDIVYSDEPDVAVVLEAEIGMTTVCPFPAFKEARIAPGDSLVASGGGATALWTVTMDAEYTGPAALTAALLPFGEDFDPVDVVLDAAVSEALTASAAGVAPEAPPSEWFHMPEADGPTALTITDDGQVYGHAALWASCHIGFPGRCQPPPGSNTHYAYFHLGEVLCADGEREAVGTITLDTGHAANGLSRVDTVRHYDDTGTAVAYVHAVDGQYGIWISGALRADAPAEKVTLLRGAKLSGDWRKVDGNLEMVALLTVNVPGFPVPRHRVEYVNGEAFSLVAAGIPLYEQDVSPDDLERFRALASAAEFAMLALADEEAA